MSIKVMSRVWADGDYQQKSDLLVALAIADFSNDEGLAWPSIDTLAKKSRCCQRSVQNIIARLVRTGKLEVRYGAGPYGTNVYRVIVGGCKSCTPATARTAVAPPPPQTRVQADAPNPSVTVIQPSGTPHKPPKPEGGSSGSEVGKSLHLERVKKAKIELADRLRHQFASEVAGGEMLWSDQKARSQHAKLRVEIRKITDQIAGMG